MGLDMYHLKATLTPTKSEEAFTFRAEDFDDHALDVLGFRRFLQTIPDTDYPARIMAVKDERTLEFLRAHCEGLFPEGVEILVGDPASLPGRVARFESDQGLDGGTRHVSALTQWTDRSGFGTIHVHGWDMPLDVALWEPTEEVLKDIQRRPLGDFPPVQIIRISYPVPAPYLGLYAEDVGYQRKGMSAAFYQEFGSQSWYVRRSDVERAGRLLDLSGTPEQNREIRDYFATQFLAEFEEGKSIFDVSW